MTASKLECEAVENIIAILTHYHDYSALGPLQSDTKKNEENPNLTGNAENEADDSSDHRRTILYVRC